MFGLFKKKLNPSKDLAKVNDALVDSNVAISQFVVKERFQYRRNTLRSVLQCNQGIYALRSLDTASKQHIQEGARKGYDWRENLFQECLEAAVPDKYMREFLLNLPEEWKPYLEPTGMFSQEQFLDSLERQVKHVDDLAFHAWDEMFVQRHGEE